MNTLLTLVSGKEIGTLSQFALCRFLEPKIMASTTFSDEKKVFLFFFSILTENLNYVRDSRSHENIGIIFENFNVRDDDDVIFFMDTNLGSLN